MKTTDEYRQKLVNELIEQSAKIDTLVIKYKQISDEQPIENTELEELRAKQQITTHKLHELENTNNHTWENIGEGG
jgi:uncharacterized membrane-anchored protein YhcB (DUF1043 family)